MWLDPRWRDAAADWMSDFELPERLVKKYTPVLARQLQEVAEDFVKDALPDLEHQAEEAARDAHDQRRIDEALGK